MSEAAKPYAKYRKKSITIRLDSETVDYFKSIATDSGVAYQTLINLYLRDCAINQRKPKMEWTS